MKIPQNIQEVPEDVPSILDCLKSPQQKREALEEVIDLITGDTEPFWLRVIESDDFCPEEHGPFILPHLNTSEELLALYGVLDPDERDYDDCVVGILEKEFIDPNLAERIARDFELISEAARVREAASEALNRM